MYLKDRAADVRELGVEKLAPLLQVYRGDLASLIHTKVSELINNKETPFHIRKCALSSLRPLGFFLSTDLLNEKVLPLLQKSLSDGVANMRIISIKIVSELAAKNDNPSFKQHLKVLCQQAQEDADSDVKHLAQAALSSI
jgi:serine/threonine-protein phosphatase 2A regulatory subunit A